MRTLYYEHSGIKPNISYAVYPGKETYSVNETVKAIDLNNLMKLID